MITLINVKGQVQIDDKLKNYSEMVRENMNLEDDRHVHYEIKTHTNSKVTIVIKNKEKIEKIDLPQNSSLIFTNVKSRMGERPNTALYYAGKIWAKVKGDRDLDLDYERESAAGNAVVGVRG